MKELPLDQQHSICGLKNQLLAYSAAAIGLLMGGEFAEAGLVYKDFPDVVLGPGPATFGLDLDDDGLVDFTFFAGAVGGARSNAVAATRGIPCIPPGRYVATGNCTATGVFAGTRFATLLRGSMVNGGMPFAAGGTSPFANGATASESFPNIGHRFLGLKIEIAGAAHFGWARIYHPARYRLTVFDAAYESEPDVGIAAGVPEPTSLGMLALGVVGVSMLRRRRV